MLSFWKTLTFFHKRSLKKLYWTFFLQNVSMFRVFEFCFFCFVQEDVSLARMTPYLFYVSNAEQWKVFVSLWYFKFCFATFKNQELVFLLRCSLHCVQILDILVCIILALFWRLHLYFLYWFFQFLKFESFQIFLRLSSFLWFAIDFIQHKAVLRVCYKTFSKNSTFYYLLTFSSGFGFVFKRLFAFDYYSVAYVFSMINELVWNHVVESIYVTEEVCCFCFICRDWKSNFGGFLSLKSEPSFLKSLTYFLRFLSAVCFRDVFEIRIMNYLRAIDSTVSFFSRSVFSPSLLFLTFLTLQNVFSDTKFCCILFLLVTVV